MAQVAEMLLETFGAPAWVFKNATIAVCHRLTISPVLCLGIRNDPGWPEEGKRR